MKDVVDSGQPTVRPDSTSFLYVPVGGAIVIVVALILGFTDIIPLGFAFGLVGFAAMVMVATAWSAAERHPASWTRPGAAHGDEDDDDEDDDAPRP